MASMKRACDCCRIRRVKCDRKEPCSHCIEHILKCTYITPIRKRGPRSISERSLKRIAEIQMNTRDSNSMAPTVTPKKVPKKLLDQCMRLYNDNLYGIWPLLCYDDLRKLLDENYDDCYTYWFLVSLSAATLGDLQTEMESEEGATYSGRVLSSLCISSRQEFDDFDSSNVLSIMMYYCLLRCFAQMSNTGTSYRLCCEAISLITVAGLHREETFKSLSFNEQQLRRKLFYLLLMTERYYAVYFHCTTRLDVTISPPEREATVDPRLSLDSFLEMVRVFTVPGKYFFNALASDSIGVSYTEDSLKRIWKELHTTPLEIEPWSYGYVDISFSRHWIIALAWKFVYQVRDRRTSFISDTTIAQVPAEIARDMLEDTFLMPSNLYEAHGPAIPTKALEIANALVEVISQYGQDMKSDAWNCLCDISKFVFSLKHCDSKMMERFVVRCQNTLVTSPISRPLELNNDNKGDFQDDLSSEFSFRP